MPSDILNQILMGEFDASSIKPVYDHLDREKGINESCVRVRGQTIVFRLREAELLRQWLSKQGWRKGPTDRRAGPDFSSEIA